MKSILTAAIVLLVPVGLARAEPPVPSGTNPASIPSNPNGQPSNSGEPNTVDTNGSPNPLPGTPGTAGTGTNYNGIGANNSGSLGNTNPAYGSADKESAGMSKDQLINKLHHVNMMEIQMGNMAQTHAHSAKVKSYGATLVKDHTKADKLVTAFAKDNKISFSESMDMGDTNKAQEKKAKMDRLGEMQGDAFDKEYLTEMIEGHTKVIGILEATKGRDGDKKLDGLIEKLLPTIRDHERAAERLQGTLPSST